MKLVASESTPYGTRYVERFEGAFDDPDIVYTMNLADALRFPDREDIREGIESEGWTAIEVD